MVFPAAVDLVTVHGQFLEIDGTPASGSVTFELTIPIHLVGDPTIIIPSRYVAHLDAGGEFTIQLPATDDPDLEPIPFSYKVTQSLSCSDPEPFYITLPASDPSVEYADLSPILSPPPSPLIDYATQAELDAVEASLHADLVHKSGTETITGTKIFDVLPQILDAPVAPDDATNKAYVDSVAGGAVVDVQTFSTPGSFTWTKPAGATMVYAIVVCPGGGGGSGRRGAAGTIRGGGGGGGGGYYSQTTFLAANLGATEAVQVAAGGLGGPAITTDDTNGTVGAGGSIFTYFIYYTLTGSTGAGAGQGGMGGITAGGGPAGIGSQTSGIGTAGIDSTATGLAAGPQTGTGAGGQGGGAGGGITAADVASGGTPGKGHLTFGGGGGAPGVIGTTGTTRQGLPGPGSGGGGASTTAAGGAGAVGTFPGGGGGGGGASANGFASGAGGQGGGGLVVIISI